MANSRVDTTTKSNAESVGSENIFISFSGAQSGLVANKISSFLPKVVQASKPFLSSNISSGSRWLDEINQRLAQVKTCIVCLLPETKDSKWIHYEVGYLSSQKDLNICPLLFGGLKATDLGYPLSNFQAKVFDKNGLLGLVEDIRKTISPGVSQDIVAETFNNNWEALDTDIKKILKDSQPSQNKAKPSLETITKQLESIIMDVRDNRHDRSFGVHPRFFVMLEEFLMFGGEELMGILRRGGVKDFARFMDDIKMLRRDIRDIKMLRHDIRDIKMLRHDIRDIKMLTASRSHASFKADDDSEEEKQ